MNACFLATHFAAFFCTTTAQLSTFLAVLVLMLPAFFTAGITGFGAQLTNGLRMRAAEAHELRCGIAKCGTFHVELNAAGHHFYFFFLQAGAGAVITNGGAGKAGIYAILILVIRFIFHTGKALNTVPPTTILFPVKISFASYC